MKAATKALRRSVSFLRRESPSPARAPLRGLRKTALRPAPSLCRGPKWAAPDASLRRVARRGFFGSFGGGASPGGGGGDTRLYDVLGVPKTADAQAIKRAYRKKVKELHPDRGGDAEQFKEVNAAYEVLGDEQRRKAYDAFGLEGMQGQMGDAAGMEDIFAAFFKGGRARQRPRMRPTVLEMGVDLEDLFDGAARKVAFRREETCRPCAGQGGQNVQTCGQCRGSGVVTKMVSLGPGMYSQSQAPCGGCQGQGTFFKKEDLCGACKGAKVQTVEAEVEVQVPKGAPRGHFVKYAGKGNEHPECDPGDLLVKLVPRPHAVFRKKGADLYMRQRIALLDSLKGFKFNVPRLDGTVATVATRPGETVQNRQVKRVAGLGLPRFGKPGAFGDLFVEFSVELPSPVGEETLKRLEEVLPPSLLGEVRGSGRSLRMEDVPVPEMEVVDEEVAPGEGPEDGQKVECQSQ